MSILKSSSNEVNDPYKLVKMRIDCNISIDEPMDNLRKHMDELHFEPYYKGLVKFQMMTEFVLYNCLINLSDQKELISPDLCRVYPFLVDKSWTYKPTDIHFMHSVIRSYYRGREISIRFKVEIRPTSMYLAVSPIKEDKFKLIFRRMHGGKGDAMWKTFKRQVQASTSLTQ